MRRRLSRGYWGGISPLKRELRRFGNRKLAGSVPVTKPTQPGKNDPPYAFVPHWFLIVMGAAIAGGVALVLNLFSFYAGFILDRL